jgi:hypothetical protein
MSPAQEQETREEAKRLAELPITDQKQIIALHRGIADDEKVPEGDRDFARERADALERHLRRLNREKKRK